MFSGLVNLLFGNPDTEDITSLNPSSEPSESIRQSARTPLVSDSISPRSLSTETAEEDGWLLVNKDETDEDEGSLPPTDSEEELPLDIWKTPRLGVPSTSYNRRGTISALQDALSESLMYDVPLSTAVPNHASMEESWFVTPPPCFTSTGPVYMETSPYENLLIEHPSMSVYHSITFIQQVVNKCNPIYDGQEDEEEERSETPLQEIEDYIPQARRSNRRKQKRRAERTVTNTVRASDLYSHPDRLKQKVEHKNSEKAHDKRDHKALCPNMWKRSNKVRAFNSKGNRHRRSDFQHCRVISGANNNRKCY